MQFFNAPSNLNVKKFTRERFQRQLIWKRSLPWISKIFQITFETLMSHDGTQDDRDQTH